MKSFSSAFPLWVWLLAAAGLGFALMLLVAWQATSVETLDPDHAAARLAAARSELGLIGPLLKRDSAGLLIRMPIAAQPGDQPPSHLVVTTYQPERGVLVRVEVPFWMLTVKGPLLETALRGTGLDIEELGVSIGDLRTFGSCTILDETRSDGSVLIVGTR